MHTDNHAELSQDPPVSAQSDLHWSFDHGFARAVQNFQSRLLAKESVLSLAVFPSADVNLASHHHLRYISSKDMIAPFFETEIVKRVIVILAVVHKDAKVIAIDRKLTNGPDMILRVRIRPEVDRIIDSNIVVEFRLPPGEDNIYQAPPPLPSASPLERLGYEADFPFLGFESALMQVHDYARGNSRASFSALSSVNTKYAFVSTFNHLWVLQMRNDGNSGSENIMVSPCFYANSTMPHVSFVVAYVLHLVIEDMIARPDNYTSPRGNLLATEGPDCMPPVLSTHVDNNSGAV
ncbi:hypothetical protein H4R20_000895 [Coemansia guatemalensis]|uniref:Uncharacterized protein n=1 Tax=Coemansia guatemalensis TaxID=2761395 RepID=A0A9W8HY21_9FUNG|nr:hypothetical protein H4R20_000895 [Coemansia guatemalensis]